MNEDIGEKNNLVDSMSDKMKELHQMLVTWREKNAPVPTELNPEYDPEKK